LADNHKKNVFEIVSLFIDMNKETKVKQQIVTLLLDKIIKQKTPIISDSSMEILFDFYEDIDENKIKSTFIDFYKFRADYGKLERSLDYAAIKIFFIELVTLVYYINWVQRLYFWQIVNQ
jgi:hypothetical protein